MARLLASLARIARTRLRNVGRRARLRAGLLAGCALAGVAAAGLLLGALTVALAERVGAVHALLTMAAAALALGLVLMIVLALESRRHRRRAARRDSLEHQLYRAAALSVLPARRPSRTVVGFALVALGALLVLARRRDGDDD